ncbi:unnamed protein product [Brassicogethes aeneus]|uniref:Rab3 GTPase-activating protein non-catalytic subunit n=1 Tax=Brassicogethes aeneus TaxID=1431903 RepID=A0A9P0B617_BRAAE|nr:unnamed protein product [Brassicogethes aeneus]
MSCQIRVTANIHDITAIRRCLFPTDDNRGGDSWLQNCEISASPTGDIIAIAQERRLVVLTSKWDSSLSLSQFQISYSGSAHEYDKIKAVICLPIVGQSQSSHVGPDWTCIMIGYDSGFVRFYTENHELLFEEQLHCENITSIKCQSQHSPRPDISSELHPEEIYVQYQSNLCVISGPVLFQNLRNCRSQLARLQAKGDPMDMSQISLNPKKWGFQDQASINDSAVVGLNLASTFDHLLTASTCGGFDTKYRAMAPHNTLVVAAGSKPYVGYHYALEGGAQPVFSDVAKAVASKLKSALPGWITGNKAPAEKQMTTAMQPAEAMGCRFGLCDIRRTGLAVLLSPDRKLAAVADALGRVSLIDSFRGVTLRMFKGYRDSQMSFIQVPDERKSKFKIGNRVALFLVVYSAKKGTLEIFSAQQGTKIATFTASKNSRLLYVNYGLMGFLTTSKSKYICQYTTIFVDNDGQIKEIMIPFHFALTEKNNKRAKDIHLYKKLRALVKSGDFDFDRLSAEVQSTCAELKTPEIRLQTVEMLFNSKDVPTEISLQCVQFFSDKFETESEAEDSNSFRTLVNNACSLLKFFLFLDATDSMDSLNGNEEEIKADTALHLGDKEMSNLQKLLDLNASNDNAKQNEVKVNFADESTNSLQDYISVFNLTNPDEITLKPNLEDPQLLKASEIGFKHFISGKSCNFKDLQQELTESKICIKDFFYLLVYYWENRNLYLHLNMEKEMENLSSLIYHIVKAENKENVLTDYNSTSKFWSIVREILLNSTRPFPALTAAMLCKNIAQKYERENELDESVASLEENIEVLSQENIQWSILIGKLEDVSLLNIILSTNPIASDCPLPKLKHDKVDVSLKYILHKGRGSVSELVAQWLTKCGINPKNITINDYIYQKTIEDRESGSLTYEEYTLEEIEYVRAQPVFDHINKLKTQFPYSLETSNLLANICWEYALAWQKDMPNLTLLEAAIKSLEIVPNVKIRHGLFNLLWNTHLKIVYESACKLINKVGKLPKERLCRQDTGLTDYQIASFLSICTEFFDSFMDTAQKTYKEPKLSLTFEPIWENGSQPLVQLAADQKDVNYDLLHLHYQLSVTLNMITRFAVKHSKPVNNLFEGSIGILFFTDMQRSVQITYNKSDLKLNDARTKFLLNIITVSLESVTIDENGKIYSAEHVKWISKCLDLARLWNIDVDLLRRYQVVQLYSSGFDLFGEELLPAINNRSELGKQLLTVAGKRMSQYLSSSPKLSENISAFSPVLTRYLDTLDGEWCSPSSLQSITSLTNQAFTCLLEDQPEYKIVHHLLEACKTLEDIES